MLFRQKELLRWLGVSVFEIWVWLLSLTIFSVLLVLKVHIKNSWQRSCIFLLWSHLNRPRSRSRNNCCPQKPLGSLCSHRSSFATDWMPTSASLSSSANILTGWTCEGEAEDNVAFCSWNWLHPPAFAFRTLMHLELSREFRNALLRALWSLFVIGDIFCGLKQEVGKIFIIFHCRLAVCLQISPL